MFSTLIKCTFCTVGPSPRLHTSSCTDSSGPGQTGADRGSSWHWGWALGELASCLGWKALQKGSSLPLSLFSSQLLPPPRLPFCVPLLKKRHEGFAGTVLGSGLSHGAPAHLSGVSCLCL